jgi:hypothetical protein
MTDNHSIDPVDDPLEIGNLGDGVDIHNNSFESLRRLIGMDDQQCNEGDDNDDINNDMISHTSHTDDTTPPARPPSVTFSSLRKLVDSGTSFCLPSAEKMRRSCSKSVNNNDTNHQTPRGVYDDSETEDGDNGNDDCDNVLSSSLLLPPESSIIRPTPSSMAPRATTTLGDADISSCNKVTTPDPLLFRHPQDFFANLLRKTTPTGKQVMSTPTSDNKGIPVSPIPFSSDSVMVEEEEEQDNIAERAVSRSIFPELEEQDDGNNDINDNVVVASDKDYNSEIEPVPPVDDKTAMCGNLEHNKLDHETFHKYSISVKFILAASIVGILFVGGCFICRHEEKDRLDTSTRHITNGSLDVATFQTMDVLTEKAVEESESIVQNSSSDKAPTPASNNEAPLEAMTGKETNIPAFEEEQVFEPEEVVPESGYVEEFPVVQTDSIEYEPVLSEDLQLTLDVMAVDDSETEGTVASDDVTEGDAETEDMEQPHRIAVIDDVDQTDELMNAMGDSVNNPADDFVSEASEDKEFVTLKIVAPENYDLKTDDAPEKGESSIDADTSELNGDDDNDKDTFESHSNVTHSVQPVAFEKQVGSKPKPLVIIENAFNKIFRKNFQEEDSDQEEIEDMKASLQVMLQTLPRAGTMDVDIDAIDDGFQEFVTDSKQSRLNRLENIKKSFGKFLRRNQNEIISDD